MFSIPLTKNSQWTQDRQARVLTNATPKIPRTLQKNP